MEIIEVDLVEKAKRGDDSAFSALYEKIYKDMYRYAFYMLGNKTDAEDIVSETVIDMYTGIVKLRDNVLFSSWAFKILSNKCKKKRKKYINKEERVENHHIGSSIDSMKQIEEQYDIEKAFNVLEEDEKQVVSLAVFGGYKSREIASIMDTKAGTVRSKLSRALKKMQVKLEIQT